MSYEKRKTVLAVDDERANLLVLNRILSPEYTLLTAKTGKDALARATGELPDVVLLDLMLPDMNGFDILRILKEDAATQKIPVIIISAGAGAAGEEKCRRLGAAGYIAKPFDGAKLRASIAAQLETAE